MRRGCFRFEILIQAERTGFPCKCVTPFLALQFLRDIWEVYRALKIYL